MRRLVIFGLDALEPRLALEAWRDELPALAGLAARGTAARLASTLPPITIPAWTAMMTSRDPGQLGLYGFRNRVPGSYALRIATSRDVSAPPLWRLLSRAGKRCLVMGVPQTFPPQPLQGILVAGPLVPPGRPFVHPPEAAAALGRAAGGEYVVDVTGFRTEARETLRERLRAMVRARFAAFRALYAAGDYDLAVLVEMATDRVAHGFWRYHDPAHRLHEPGSPFAGAVRECYRLVDEELGRTLARLPPDTSVMVVSDHGVQAMEGAVALNEWLRREGYLVLEEEPTAPTRLRPEMVDWRRTRAWGEGGYYGRVFLNVAGRDPEGIVPPGEVAALRRELAAKLAALPDDAGRPLGTVVYEPERVYRAVAGLPPDLIVYFGDLRWRSAGTVGLGRVHLRENDTGPDDANHAPEGVFVWDGVQTLPGGPVSIYDVAPTVLRFFGLEVPPGMIGRALQDGKETA